MSNSSGSATNATETAAQRLRRTVAAATVDSRLRDRLLADPRAVLAEAGLTLPARVAIAIKETAIPEVADAAAGGNGGSISFGKWAAGATAPALAPAD